MTTYRKKIGGACCVDQCSLPGTWLPTYHAKIDMAGHKQVPVSLKLQRCCTNHIATVEHDFTTGTIHQNQLMQALFDQYKITGHSATEVRITWENQMLLTN